MSDSDQKFETLLHIKNRYFALSGDPPAIDCNSDRYYVGYFQNNFADQWVFVFDRATRKGKLFSGSLDWNKPLEVVKGEVDGLKYQPEVSFWLTVCWETATREI